MWPFKKGGVVPGAVEPGAVEPPKKCVPPDFDYKPNFKPKRKLRPNSINREQYKVKLEIHHKNGTYSAVVSNKDGSKPKRAFITFVKWFHSRKDSDIFVFSALVGETDLWKHVALRRCDITSYALTEILE